MKTENFTKIKIPMAILVEGKYDKILLERFVDANIYTTNGFSVFNAKEKCALLKKIAEKQGLIVLTDSDPAGFVIRNKLKGMLPKDKVVNIYAPAIFGKESRKKESSKAGILGIEGLTVSILKELFEKNGVVALKGDENCKDKDYKVFTKADMYERGLCGKENSSVIRDDFCRENDLPTGMTAKALLEAINTLGIVMK